MILNRLGDNGILHTEVTCIMRRTTDSRAIGAYLRGVGAAHYPLPARLEDTNSFITILWLWSPHGRIERKIRKWWLTLRFDNNNHYLG